VCPVGGRASVGGCPIGFTNRQPFSPDLDCDEGTASTHPGAPETCNGVDDDCDGAPDDGLRQRVRFIDTDGDGSEGTAVMRCEGDPDSVPFSLDCNETRTDTYVGATELCDRRDNNCSLGGAAAGGVDLYEDEDNDGYAPIGAACAGGFPTTDCDDRRATDNPGAIEVCSGTDTDCDGTIDEDPEAADSCNAPHASAGCAMDGACAIFACDYGYGDCNGDYADGCEVDFSSSSANCGGCGFTCGASAPCVATTMPGGLCDAIASIGAGFYQGCLRFTSGAVSCAGRNDRGQLGDGSTITRTSPVAVSGITGALDVDGGQTFTCAALGASGVRCWGRGEEGQLGNGARPGAQSTPVSVLGLTGSAVQLAAGSTHACARLATTGEVQCWGLNQYGQLGDGISDHGMTCYPSTECSMRAVTVSGITGAVDISSGYDTTCAALGDGTVRCWGRNEYGQLGDAGAVTQSNTPVTVSGVANATRVAVGARHACAVSNDGSVRCWGQNQLGAIGNGATSNSPLLGATQVRTSSSAFLGGVTFIDASALGTCAVRAGGRVACWGGNGFGALGQGSASSVVYATDVANVLSASDIAMGEYFGCARMGQRMSCWGQNDFGQYGGGNTAAYTTAFSVPGLTRAADVAMYDESVCGRATSGTLACWGDNRYGKLGQNPIGYKYTVPVAPVTPITATSIGISTYTTCAVEPAGTVRCWGRVCTSTTNCNTNTETSTPTALAGVTNAMAVRAAYENHCFLHADGTLSCMGNGGNGQLGNGSSASSWNTPVAVSTLSDVRSFDVSRSHVCAVEGDGRGYCWGANGASQLGRGSSGGSFNTPQLIIHYDDLVDVRVGNGFTCVLRATNDIACWGSLIDGTTTTPRVVSGLPAGRVVALDAADDGSICALLDVPPPTPSRPLLCWNSPNADGQMGVGTQLPVTRPTQVRLYTDFDGVTTGTRGTCAVRDSHSAVECFGWGLLLGDACCNNGPAQTNAEVSSSEPSTVVGFP
jgi:alpha-tubulin suppressor-like RCC1 family protein